MSLKVTIDLPDELAQRVHAVATQTSRRVEEVVLDWIDRAHSETALESLPDDQLLLLCNGQMDAAQQDELSELLQSNREAQLRHPERARLDELMGIYRRGLIRKAQAIRAAVARGLKPRLE